MLTIQFDANSSSHELIGQMKTRNMCPYYANGSKKLKGVKSLNGTPTE
jgi:hypothetical protein